MMSSSDELLAALQPALEKYSAACAEHGQDYDTPRDDAACKCGWKPERRGRWPRNQVGRHISAAHKRAEKVYDAESAEIVRQRIARSTR